MLGNAWRIYALVLQYRLLLVFLVELLQLAGSFDFGFLALQRKPSCPSESRCSRAAASGSNKNPKPKRGGSFVAWWLGRRLQDDVLDHLSENLVHTKELQCGDLAAHPGENHHVTWSCNTLRNVIRLHLTPQTIEGHTSRLLVTSNMSH